MRSILNRGLIGLNLEFSFSNTGCHNKVKDSCVSYYQAIARIHIFPKGISATLNANSLVQILNLGNCVHF